MIVRAPGKVVLSGAYAVLAGAPALVASVDRYAVVDTERRAERTTEEVAAAMALGYLDRALWFDASALRTAVDGPAGASRKLGLGSSAAVLVASIGAHLTVAGTAAAGLPAAAFPPALAAHRRAQPRGSGIDVAASCFGGVLLVRRGPDGVSLTTSPASLPTDLVLVVFAADESASTAELVAQTERLRRAQPSRHAELLGRAAAAATLASGAQRGDEWIAALAGQYAALGALGRAAAAPIVTAAVAELGALAQREGAAFGPAGAGGGDLALFAGAAAPSIAFRDRAAAVGMRALDVALGARGLHVPFPQPQAPGPPGREGG